MRNTLRRSVSAASAAALALTAGLFLGTTATAQEPDAAPSESAAIDDFGACVSANRQGDLLLLVDQSSSLQTADPDNARVDAAKYLVRQLATFSERSNADVQIAVAGFDDTYQVRQSWSAASDDSVPNAVDALAAQNTGQATDYWTALDGARSELADRASNGRTCQAIAFFTDGKIDFTPQPGLEKPFLPGETIDNPEAVTRAIEASTNSLCRPTGLVDQIRSSEVKVFAVGLAPDEETRRELEFLESLATGQGAQDCGDITSPTPGAYFPVTGIDDMLFAFGALSAPGQSQTEQRGEVCDADEPCERGRHHFVLDDTIETVTILANADTDAASLVLESPNGDEIRIAASDESGQRDLAGTTIDFAYESPRTVSLDMRSPENQNWTGEWSLAFVAESEDARGAETRSTIRIDPNMTIRLAEGDETTLRIGQPSEVDFSLVRGSGDVVDPAIMSERTEFDIEIVPPGGEPQPVAMARRIHDLAEPITVDVEAAGVAPGAATLRTVLRVTTKDTRRDDEDIPGTPLQPISTDIPVQIALPVGYPTLPAQLDFGTFDGAGDMTGSIEVTGPGCAWVPAGGEPNYSGVPDEMAPPALTSSSHGSAEDCLQLGEGETGELDVTLGVVEEGNGTLAGTIPVMLSADQDDAPDQEVGLAFTANLQKELDNVNFLLALLAALVLGPGIPLALLYLVKYFTSRIPAGAVTAVRFPVTFAGASVLREGELVEFGRDELIQPIPGSARGGKSLDVEGITLQTKMGKSPFGAGYVVAKTPGALSSSDLHPGHVGAPPQAKLPLALQGHWLVLYSPEQHGPESAEIIAFGSGTDGQSTRSKLLESIRQDASHVFEELKSVAAASGQAPGDGGGAGGPMGGGPMGGAMGGGAAGGGAGSAWPGSGGGGGEPTTQFGQPPQGGSTWPGGSGGGFDGPGNTGTGPADGQSGGGWPGAGGAGGQGNQGNQGGWPGAGQGGQGNQGGWPGAGQGGHGNQGNQGNQAGWPGAGGDSPPPDSTWPGQ